MAASFSEAVKNKPDFVEALFNLALTYHEMGDPLSAEKYYLLTLQSNPALIRAHLKLAELFTETDRKQRAIDQYRRVFNLKPEFFVQKPTLSAEHQYINVFNLFRGEIETKLQHNPDDVNSNLILAKIFRAQGQNGKAANLARKVLSFNPNNSEAKEILAKVQ
jgi:Tfp pilus assembly protein PilF